MKCHIVHIGVIDKQGKVHSVAMQPGLNIITGKSSTGKSALIEIFDYCFGSSEYTVPVGVITSVADLYFVTLNFSNSCVVLARRANSDKALIREIPADSLKGDTPKFEKDFFEDKLFLRLSSFKKELGGYFSLTITDVDTDLEEKEYRGRKSPAPSPRSFTSFMLQHQSLVANKHAIFYRFDEKEKREQTIEHTKIFLGYADQDYYLLSQEINTLQVELRRLEFLLPKKQEEDAKRTEVLDGYLKEFSALAGKPLLEVSSSEILINPYRWAKHIRRLPLDFDSASDEHSLQLRALDTKRSRLVVELRNLERDRRAVQSSIEYADRFSSDIANLSYPHEAKDYVAECPFCHHETNTIELEANNLSEAVDWLNRQLSHSPYMRESFKSEEARINKLIAKKVIEVRTVEHELSSLKGQVKEVQERESLYEMALKVKLKIENYLEQVSESSLSKIEEEIASKKQHIKKIRSRLKGYGIEDRLSSAQKEVATVMNEIGRRLDFEESYQPVGLEFSFDTFDLWNNKSGEKIYLRSMGSGANWLYCHLTLFMGLHKLFCKLGNTCKIPSIMFFDQPTQVYFPNTSLDTKEKFVASDLVGEAGKEKVDDDIHSVERFFSEIAKYCNETELQTGIRPQVIITDHADNLTLEDGLDFESFVRARWRGHGQGFIKQT